MSIKYYELDISVHADEDMVSAGKYISSELKNETAAVNFRNGLQSALYKLTYMPYKNRKIDNRELEEYGLRMSFFKNHNIFYKIHEEDSRVKIVRVLFAKQNWIGILKHDIEETPFLINEEPAEYDSQYGPECLNPEDLADMAQMGTPVIKKSSSEFRNNYSSVSELCNEEKAHVMITKNGKKDLVAMSVAEFERLSSYRG